MEKKTWKTRQKKENTPHLLVVGTDEVKDKTAVHEGEQAVQEESQAAI